jgi:hypothetical protein
LIIFLGTQINFADLLALLNLIIQVELLKKPVYNVERRQVIKNFAASNVSTTTNLISKQHTFLRGQAVVFSSGGGTAGGFQNRIYVAGRNRIWSFGNADAYGLSYFQGPDYIGLHFGTATQAASQFWVDSSGISQSSASSRATIFYDSNNTGYYVDSSSTSNLNNVAVNRIWAGSDAGVDGSISTNNWFRSVGATGWYNQTYSGGWYMSDSTYVRSYNDNIVITNSSFRSPIFYDINDTTYYTDPASTSNLYGLQLTGASNKYLYLNPGTGYEAMLRVQGGTGNSWYAGKRTTSTTQADTSGFHFYSDTGADTVVGFGTDGTIKAKGDVVAYSSSDRQLKDNVLPIENALEKVKQIGGYTFDWNDMQGVHKGHDVGVIAQEIEAVMPEIVITRDNGFKAVKYEKIVALLIEAVKEQQKQIEELKELVNKLINK